MGNRHVRTAAALSACVAGLVFAVGDVAANHALGVALTGSSASSSVTPPPAPGGALPVQPVGGGGCIIGLNCGCVHGCQKPHPRPPAGTGDPQRAAPAPAPQNP